MKQKELTAHTRANLFAKLAQSEKAALPVLDSLEILSASADQLLSQRLTRFRNCANSGQDIPESGLRSGIFLPWEARLLRAAEVSGKLAESYAALGKRYASHARRSSRLKSSLIFPLLIFVMMVSLAPLPALLRGEISGQWYLLQSAGRVLLLFTGLYMLTYNWKRLSASGADSSIFSLMLHLPLVGSLIRQQQQRDFLYSLGLLLQAGVPTLEALTVAAGSISHPGLRRKFGNTADLVHKGETVSASLESCGLLQDSDSYNILHTGEYSGRLTEMIHHLVSQLDEQLEQKFETLATWAPRIIYLLILVNFALG